MRLGASELLDSTKEQVDALDRVFHRATLGVAPHRLVDEKLGAAAAVAFAQQTHAVVSRWKALLLNSANAVGRILNEPNASGLRRPKRGRRAART